MPPYIPPLKLSVILLVVVLYETVTSSLLVSLPIICAFPVLAPEAYTVAKYIPYLVIISTPCVPLSKGRSNV